jgi:hypothetical protein
MSQGFLKNTLARHGNHQRATDASALGPPLTPLDVGHRRPCRGSYTDAAGNVVSLTYSSGT